WGLRKRGSRDVDTRSVTARILPPNASSHHRRSTSPGSTSRIGATPPKVHAYWSGVGENSTITVDLRPGTTSVAVGTRELALQVVGRRCDQPERGLELG